MSQLNNRNSYPTIPALLRNRVDSLEHSPNNYAGLSLNMINFRDNRFKKFYKEYKTVTTTYDKLVKDLKSFLSDIQTDFNKQVLKCIEDLDSSKQTYIDIAKEHDGLERNRHIYQENDFESDSDRAKKSQLYWKKYFNLKSQKNKAAQQYNERCADLNQFIVKISILISHITEGRIFYTPIFNSHKDYTISLKDFVDEFGKLVNITDAAMKKKGEVIAKLINESMKNLDKTTKTFDVNAIMELKQIRFN
ncbi:hypothetical protein KQX54_016529 [Cotesia glomerata]|uniref:Uncharacterized protein n=1 Tax=Cotesia glomerata TaxID=32391 RepID=A0AAV7IXI7_COTGL|nr:hypothetical protein KQX54_016529 [Cotesia glomerata]